MAVGDIQIAYAARSTLTQTNLDALASSATWVAGWVSATIDNSSNLYTDYVITAVLQAESAGLTAGEARMYLVAELNDSAYPDLLSAGTEGTEGAGTFHDINVRDAWCPLVAYSLTDTTASQFYVLNCRSVAQAFGGTVPRRFFIFIAHSMVAALESTGDPNQVYVQGVYNTIDQS